MKTIKAIAPGTPCTDKATLLSGRITHLRIDMGGNVTYLFQPAGVDIETEQPLSKLLVEAERLDGIAANSLSSIDVPFEILGTIVTDEASGFAGMAVAFIMHPNGCFHVQVQPRGVLKKTGQPIRTAEFDLRECRGEMIRKMSPEERAASQQEKPSPTGDVFPDAIFADKVGNI